MSRPACNHYGIVKVSLVRGNAGREGSTIMVKRDLTLMLHLDHQTKSERVEQHHECNFPRFGEHAAVMLKQMWGNCCVGVIG